VIAPPDAGPTCAVVLDIHCFAPTNDPRPYQTKSLTASAASKTSVVQCKQHLTQSPTALLCFAGCVIRANLARSAESA
jgi:hypothetical protein